MHKAKARQPQVVSSVKASCGEPSLETKPYSAFNLSTAGTAASDAQ